MLFLLGFEQIFIFLASFGGQGGGVHQYIKPFSRGGVVFGLTGGYSPPVPPEPTYASRYFYRQQKVFLTAAKPSGPRAVGVVIVLVVGGEQFVPNEK